MYFFLFLDKQLEYQSFVCGNFISDGFIWLIAAAGKSTSDKFFSQPSAYFNNLMKTIMSSANSEVTSHLIVVRA